ncbi:unnamed protein product [Malus baccata var. baccata]
MTSWKLIEDVTFSKCWVHTTHDPITGNEMDKREMWSKITKAFCDVHGKEARSSQGLQGRWKKLNASFTCWKNAISHAFSSRYVPKGLMWQKSAFWSILEHFWAWNG